MTFLATLSRRKYSVKFGSLRSDNSSALMNKFTRSTLWYERNSQKQPFHHSSSLPTTADRNGKLRNAKENGGGGNERITDQWSVKNPKRTNHKMKCDKMGFNCIEKSWQAQKGKIGTLKQKKEIKKIFDNLSFLLFFRSFVRFAFLSFGPPPSLRFPKH